MIWLILAKNMTDTIRQQLQIINLKTYCSDNNNDIIQKNAKHILENCYKTKYATLQKLEI